MTRIGEPNDCSRSGAFRLCVVVVSIGLMSLFSCDGSSGDTSAGELNSDRVATVGIRALIQAGVQDRDRSFLAYQGVQTTDDGWRVMLSGGASHLEVKRLDGDFVVVGVGGPGAAARFRPELIGYREPAEPEPPGFEFYDVEIASGPVVEASFFFRGPIPSSYQAECRVEIADEDQNTIYEGEIFSPPVPRYESARGGGFYSEPVPVSAAEGSPRISCEAS